MCYYLDEILLIMRCLSEKQTLKVIGGSEYKQVTRVFYNKFHKLYRQNETLFTILRTSIDVLLNALYYNAFAEMRLNNLYYYPKAVFYKLIQNQFDYLFSSCKDYDFDEDLDEDLW